MTAEPGTFSVEGERVARCDPEVVMSTLLDSTEWPRWQPEIESIEGPERVTAGDVVVGHAKLLGFGVAGESRIESVEPLSFEEDVLVGVKMRIRYEVATAGDGTRITSKLVAERATGVSGRILTFFLRRRLRTMQRTALDNLVARCEAPSRGADIG